tara:strand:- start:13963 stop:15108 length:1146 start_codon:yes stop_codon:yes gene_type:complete
MEIANRSGGYITQSNGYRAFIPNPLPPVPHIEIDDEMQTLLSKADRALGRLDGSIQTLPDPHLFVIMYVRKEAVLSSQIEGTQSSLNDLLEAEAKIFDTSRPKDVDEIVNYVSAMNYGLSRLEELPLSTRLIKEIHTRLLQGARGQYLQPGELRTSQNWIGARNCTLSEAVFVPPPPHSVPECLSDLEKFLHDEAPLPLLIRIGLAHAQFETIHPFLDGNGRVGRLLITFLLCQQEILQKPVLYISHYFKKNREHYYELLQSIRDTGDWETWLKFFLNGISDVAKEATETARKIVDLREKHRLLITHNFGRVAGNGLTILEQLYQTPIITVSDIGRICGVSYQAANNLMNKFIEDELLVEVTGNIRNRRFRYGSYINLFSN